MCWLSVTPASGADTTRRAAGGGLASALVDVATKLTEVSVAASSAKGASSSAAAASSGGAASTLGAQAPSGGAVLSAVARGRTAPHLRRMAAVRSPIGLSARPGGPATVRVGSTTEFGSPRVLAVAARRRNWLGVIATERPNNRLAWVRRRSPQLRLRRTRWSLHANLSKRTLTLRKAGRRVRRMTVAIGRPGSETPTGRFAVTDKLSGSQFGSYYGCCILALSGHQPNTPPGWTGGNRLAIHGTDSPSTIGTAASAGCLRASDADLAILMRKVPLGTQVFIRR